MEELWEAAKAGDQHARNELVRAHIPLVKYVTAGLMHSLASHARHDDLFSYGLTGLMHAVDRFDPHRGVKFPAFAILRIKGSIIDELRSQDWASRNVRRSIKAIHAAEDALNARLDRHPSLEEIAEEAGVTPDEAASILYDHEQAATLTLSIAVDQEEQTDIGVEDIDRSSILFEQDYAERMSDALAVLDESDRALIALYYFEDTPFSSISELTDVTESRILQVHKRSLRRLLANV